MFRHPVIVLVVAILLVASWAADGPAQGDVSGVLSSSRVELPDPDAKGTGAGNTGFKSTIDVTNSLGIGYVRVQVNLASTLGPASATRDLGVRLTPIDRHIPADRAVAVELPFSFEQGQSQLSLERSFPKWTIGNSYRIEITEDGIPLEQHAVEIGGRFPGIGVPQPSAALVGELTTSFLLVDTKPKTLSAGDGILSKVDPLQQSYALRLTTLGQMPTDWRLLRDINCIVLDYGRWMSVESDAATDAAIETARSENDAKRAIRDWVMMGGTLVVLGSPDAATLAEGLNVRFVEVKQDEEEFAALVYGTSTESVSVAEHYRKWISEFRNQPPDVQASSINEVNRMLPNGPRSGITPTSKVTADQIAADLQWISDLQTIVKDFQTLWDINKAHRHRVGAGQIIGLPGNAIDTVSSFSALQKLVGFRRSPMLQRGVDPMMGDSRSRRWLIPGVAQPPVYTFMGILTLFVLLVGPVAYRWTTRGHRSHLMFLIAPILALFTTVAMFTYSIVADGFGTSVRVRQITWIDGSSGDAAERTRSTLFAGISPLTGLRFPADAELMVYPSGGKQTWRELPSQVDEVRLRAVIDDDAQRFGSALLPSRTQTQFVSHQVRRGLGTLSMKGLQPFDSGGSIPNSTSVELSSSLPFPIRDLVVCSHDGRYWGADMIGAGETVSAHWFAKTQDASRQLGKLYIRHQLVGAVSESGGSRRNQRIRDLVVYLNREINPGGMVVTDGGMERWMNEQIFVKGELPPGMFVGVSDPTSDVIAVDQAEQIASVRYVVGTLQ